jgi:hypothetical protein
MIDDVELDVAGLQLLPELEPVAADDTQLLPCLRTCLSTCYITCLVTAW